MTKEELNEYAAANRSRLEKQKIVLGDVVKLLVGRFAGEMGVVKGIMVSGNDFADPYYEVDMHCEVPDKYKCRQTLLTPNIVIGGLSAYEFEVIGNRATDTEPTSKFKVGDKVVVSKDMSWGNEGSEFNRYILTHYPSEITEIMGKNATIKTCDVYGIIPLENLTPYVEPTATEEEEKEQKRPKYPIGTKVYTIYGNGVVDKTIEGDIAVRLDGGGFCGVGSITAVKEDGDYW